jgi:hypothetical protein
VAFEPPFDVPEVFPLTVLPVVVAPPKTTELKPDEAPPRGKAPPITELLIAPEMLPPFPVNTPRDSFQFPPKDVPFVD